MALTSDLVRTPTTLLFWLLMFAAMVIHVISDASKDREECAQQLAGMATCLPYVEGQAKAPTPDCCSGLKQVLQQNKKCLCVIIRDRNDPDLGLTINVTLALGLPSTCHATANVSKCPELLHLAPNSPEAQVFYQFTKNGSNSSSNAAAVSPAVATANPPTGAAGANARIAPVAGNGGGGGHGKERLSSSVRGVFALAFHILLLIQ